MTLAAVVDFFVFVLFIFFILHVKTPLGYGETMGINVFSNSAIWVILIIWEF